MNLSPGAWIGPYHLESPLGAGGFGEVWKAREGAGTGSAPIAIKVARGEAGARTLLRQVIAQTRAKGPRVLPVLAHDPAHDPPYAVFPLVDGGSLRARLVQEDLLYVKDAVTIMCDVLLALDAAHQAGVPHGDLKPSNILLTRDGKAFVTDFAGREAPACDPDEIERSGPAPAGVPMPGPATWLYAAPERRRGMPPSPKADLYSAGLILHEMLTGEAYHLRFPVPGLPGYLSSLIKTATAPNPILRASSAEDFLLALAIMHEMSEAGFQPEER